MSYEQISANLKRAVLVSEDSAFWQHDGVDMEQLKASIEKDLERGRMVRGGSTITQQLAKNLYLSPSRNPIRKLRELIISRRLEAALTKRRILELYLNVVEWGDGIYGAEAAARTYFHRSAATLGPGNPRCWPVRSSIHVCSYLHIPAHDCSDGNASSSAAWDPLRLRHRRQLRQSRSRSSRILRLADPPSLAPVPEASPEAPASDAPPSPQPQ